ncbi:MAG: hypothetical protein JW934_04230, partial [Anaerolineae bacterium]|nr:hypothetical protein [Anaerolineae bacterium]
MRERQALGRLDLPSGWGFILIAIVAVLILCVVLATWSWWRPPHPFTSQQEYELFIKRLVESVLNQDEAWFI